MVGKTHSSADETTRSPDSVIRRRGAVTLISRPEHRYLHYIHIYHARPSQVNPQFDFYGRPLTWTISQLLNIQLKREHRKVCSMTLSSRRQPAALSKLTQRPVEPRSIFGRKSVSVSQCRSIDDRHNTLSVNGRTMIKGCSTDILTAVSTE